MKMHDEKFDKRHLELSSFVSFLMGFTQAVTIYILSSYFKEAAGTENVGVFYALSYLVVLFILLNFHQVVRKIGKSNAYYFSVIAKIIIVTLLSIISPSFLGIFLLMLYIIAGAVEWLALDIIIESFSTDSVSGRVRGLHLTILNAGFLFGPFVSTYLLGKIGFQAVFIFSLIFNCFILIFALIAFRKINHRFSKRLGVKELLRKALARPNIMRIYYISFILEFFFALMIIYAPIYLNDMGFSWKEIGYIFTAMLVPFVILQYPVGFLADKKLGEKELLIFSIIIMGISTIAIYFIESQTIAVWAFALFATRIGAAMIEILRDSYFYKRIDGRDVDMIDFFRTALPTAYIAATVLSSILLFIMPSIKLAFILTGAIVLSAIYPAIKLADNKCEKELENCQS